MKIELPAHICPECNRDMTKSICRECKKDLDELEATINEQIGPDGEIYGHRD